MEASKTILYEREKSGIKVVAFQEVTEIIAPVVPETPAEGGEVKVAKVATKKAPKRNINYTVQGTVNGQIVEEIPGDGYRTTIKMGRDMFKRVWDQYGPKKPVEAAAAETPAQA